MTNCGIEVFKLRNKFRLSDIECSHINLMTEIIPYSEHLLPYYKIINVSYRILIY
jgi:hypothetical protein